MSELNNTPSSVDDGIPEVSFTMEVSETVQAPVDDTLSISGMAADAEATGEAIADAKSDLQEEIDALPTALDIAEALFPVGCIYMSTSSSAPTFGGDSWQWQEIMIPVTYGDLINGSRDYQAVGTGDTPGDIHFWLRLSDSEG